MSQIRQVQSGIMDFITKTKQVTAGLLGFRTDLQQMDAHISAMLAGSAQGVDQESLALLATAQKQVQGTAETLQALSEKLSKYGQSL